VLPNCREGVYLGIGHVPATDDYERSRSSRSRDTRSRADPTLSSSLVTRAADRRCLGTSAGSRTPSSLPLRTTHSRLDRREADACFPPATTRWTDPPFALSPERFPAATRRCKRLRTNPRPARSGLDRRNSSAVGVRAPDPKPMLHHRRRPRLDTPRAAPLRPAGSAAQLGAHRP
jgi:hypothetical protein